MNRNSSAVVIRQPARREIDKVIESCAVEFKPGDAVISRFDQGNPSLKCRNSIEGMTCLQNCRSFNRVCQKFLVNILQKLGSRRTYFPLGRVRRLPEKDTHERVST